ncbi:DUF3048 domain-containing protein [Streptomyces sp. 4N509B]|uniref:DUF3048 domain-containing protein n=1 Tax=Streptomyces sp. 4N509B TaxID=3457413 RepID=UPI003FD640E1
MTHIRRDRATYAQAGAPAATRSVTGKRSRTRAALGVVAMVGVTGLAGLAGCTDDDGGGYDGGTDGGDGSDARGGELSPFTGEETDPGDEPVLAVKIDNAPAARPQTGLDEADIVYVEPVEGGMSRFLAVYSSELPDDPDEIGPVRSGRESDLELLEQFDDPAFAYSGINSRLTPVYEEAARGGELHLVPPATVPEGYERNDERDAPYNLYADPATLVEAAPDASDASDIGFRFGEAPDSGGERTRQFEVSYPAAHFGFTWNGDDEHWNVSLDGDPAEAEPATVIVQQVPVRDSSLHDVLGSASPYAETVGSGSATVLRDGRAYDAEWSRPSQDDGTEFTTPDGEPLRFDTGPVWVVLQAR